MLKRVSGALNRIPGALETAWSSGDALVEEWDEPSAVLVTSEGDYAQDISVALADTTGFTFLIRCEMRQDALSSYFFRLQNSTGYSQMLIGRINGLSGNKVALTLIDDAAVTRQFISSVPFQVADGFETILVTGDRTADDISIFMGDRRIYQAKWIEGGWTGTSTLDFTTNSLPVQQAFVGRESGSSTRSDMNLRRVAYWNSRIIDPAVAANRRTLYDTTGEIVSTLPSSPYIDIQGTYGALWNNVLGTSGNWGLQGTVTYQDQSKKRMLVGNDGGTTYGATASYGDLTALWLDDMFNGIDIDQLIFRDSNNEVRLVMDGSVQQPGVTTINVTLPADYTGVQPQPMALVWDTLTKYTLTSVNQDVFDYMAEKEGTYITLTVDPV